jgi:hypothetical protein
MSSTHSKGLRIEMEKSVNMMKHLACAMLGITTITLTLESHAARAANFDQQQICRATIGAVMGRDPRIIKVSSVDLGIIHVSYLRPDDGTLWEQRCRIDGQKVVWATKSGRWREDPMDEVITYTATGALLTINQKFADGSTSTKSYTPAQLALK